MCPPPAISNGFCFRPKAVLDPIWAFKHYAGEADIHHPAEKHSNLLTWLF